MGILTQLLTPALSAEEPAGLPLDRAALEIATIEYPGLDPEPSLAVLDSLASELEGRLTNLSDGQEFVAAANHLLFEELGFKGNEEHYYDPRNSCLNEVLARRLGIPITLSIIYMEIGRRLAKPIYGIGLPGHFLIEYSDASFSAYLDPYHGGRILSPGECLVLAAERSGLPFQLDSAVLRRVTKKQILARMLTNLLGIYIHGMAIERALKVLDLLITAWPDAAEQYKRRGLIHFQLHHYRAAKRDFETYVLMVPDAPDRGEVERHIEAMYRWLAAVN